MLYFYEMQLEMTAMVRHVCTRRTYVGGASKSTFVFRRAWESICILKTKLKTMLKPDLVNTNQSHWLLPSLFFTKAGNRHACPHLPMPLSAREQQEQAALQGRTSREPWVAAGQTRTGTSSTAPRRVADKKSDRGRSGGGDQGQPRGQ